MYHLLFRVNVRGNFYANELIKKITRTRRHYKFLGPNPAFNIGTAFNPLNPVILKVEANGGQLLNYVYSNLISDTLYSEDWLGWHTH